MPDDINECLNALAKRTGRTKTFYMREAIRKHIAELENSYESQNVQANMAKSNKDNLTQGKSKNIAELLAMPEEIDFDFEIPERSHEIIRPTDLS